MNASSFATRCARRRLFRSVPHNLLTALMLNNSHRVLIVGITLLVLLPLFPVIFDTPDPIQEEITYALQAINYRYPAPDDCPELELGEDTTSEASRKRGVVICDVRNEGEFGSDDVYGSIGGLRRRTVHTAFSAGHFAPRSLSPPFRTLLTLSPSFFSLRSS